MTRENLRIALVSPYDLDVPGGVQSHVHHLADELRTGGDEVLVVGPGAGGGTWEGVGSSVGIPFNDSVAPLALTPGAARRTVTTLTDFEPDVVHVHEPAVPWVGLAAALRGPRPVVATFHAWSDRDRLYRLARPLLRRVGQRLDAAIAVSPAAAAYHGQALGWPATRFRIVPNAVDVARFRDAQRFDELAGEAPLLVFVGRLESRKGVVALMKAFVALKARRPAVRLVVVGDGPERDRCQSLLPARLRTDVSFVGRVPDEDLPRFYRSADVFVAPALGGESFGIVLLEAMAAGVPVVASDIPGYRTTLTDGVQGRLVAPGDHHGLADALNLLVDNPRLRDAMGREGQRTAAEYDWPVVTATIRSIYRSLQDTTI